VNVLICQKEVLRVGAISAAHKPAVTKSFEREVKHFEHPVVLMEAPAVCLFVPLCIMTQMLMDTDWA
jgi:hypothetical protein